MTPALLVEAAKILLILPSLSALHFQCAPCNEISCPPDELPCPPEERVVGGPCGCCPVCGAGIWEKCGGASWGENRPCQKGLVCKYRLGMTLGEERVGLCELSSCRSVVCSYRQVCGFHSADSDVGIPHCGCTHFRCRDRVDLVCGHDGRTYKSVCHLQKLECTMKKFVGLDHFGACRTPPRLPHPPPICWEEKAFTTSLETNELDDEGELPTTPSQANYNPYPKCVHNGKVLKPFSIVPYDEGNPCVFRKCDPFTGWLMELTVPGCKGYPAEVDYNVTQPVVHGGWSNWSGWFKCGGDRDCGNGTHYRTRTCTAPPPSNTGRNCTGIDFHTNMQDWKKKCRRQRLDIVERTNATSHPHCWSLNPFASFYCAGFCRSNSKCCQPVYKTVQVRAYCPGEGQLGSVVIVASFKYVSDCVCAKRKLPGAKLLEAGPSCLPSD